MGEYWISREKFFCKYCKCWLQPDKQSIRFHEQGKGHQETVKEFFRLQKENKLQGAKDEASLLKEMARIEKAALRQHEKDLEHFGGQAPPVAPPPPPPKASPVPPPPPPRAAAKAVGTQGAAGATAVTEDAGAGSACVQASAPPQGGLEFAPNTPCEVYLVEEGDWVEALVLSVGEAPEGGGRRVCEVAYFQDGQEEPTVLQGIPLDRVRASAATAAAKLEDLPPPQKQDYTGYGGWQTVSVRLIDEKAEAEAARQKAIAEANAIAEAEAKAERARMLDEAMEAGDALSSYDPWGTGKYKGVDLEAVEAPGLHSEPVSAGGASVGFKKRKAVGGAAKFRGRPKATEE